MLFTNFTKFLKFTKRPNFLSGWHRCALITLKTLMLERVRLGLSQKKAPRDSTLTYSPRGLTFYLPFITTRNLRVEGCRYNARQKSRRWVVHASHSLYRLRGCMNINSFNLNRKNTSQNIDTFPINHYLCIN